MDALDRLADVTRPLLTLVDDTLAEAGAPPGHAVWPALRRVGLLPSAAVQAVAALDPVQLPLRDAGQDVAAVAGALPTPAPWSGEAADAYDSVRRRLGADLCDLAERIGRAAAFAEALGSWTAATRAAVADVLAEVMCSGQAVTLLAAEDAFVSERASAAADIAARVLGTVSDVYVAGEDLLNSAAALSRY